MIVYKVSFISNQADERKYKENNSSFFLPSLYVIFSLSKPIVKKKGIINKNFKAVMYDNK